jgi:hypothetical protein
MITESWYHDSFIMLSGFRLDDIILFLKTSHSDSSCTVYFIFMIVHFTEPTSALPDFTLCFISENGHNSNISRW